MKEAKVAGFSGVRRRVSTKLGLWKVLVGRLGRGEGKGRSEIEGWRKGDGMETEWIELLTGIFASSLAWGHSGQVIDSPLMRLCEGAGAGSCWRESEAVDIKLSSQVRRENFATALHALVARARPYIIGRLYTRVLTFDHVF
jgi:hypothetical protein